MTAASLVRRHIHVRGTVQGVGFRPFVHRLATRHGLSGWVANRMGDVEIEVEGPEETLGAFVLALHAEAPPLARIGAIKVSETLPDSGRSFEILPSNEQRGPTVAVPPDTSPCDDCRSELFDASDRRYRYPFINCTNCGPRFTIIEDLPYDRARTTMAKFPMCSSCRREYEDPTDRRFHAEPIACPACGPRLWLEQDGGVVRGDALDAALALLRSGSIVALKGLGGFHLACDASSSVAVRRLRERKRRPAKPFAVMFPSMEMIRSSCWVRDSEALLIASRERPIVLLERREDSTLLCPEIALGLREVGVMQESTPLHALLLEAFQGPLVMTSGNLAEEPIAVTNEEASVRLNGIADAFLMHDRSISSRYDDSIMRLWDDHPMVIRRARGLAPTPIEVPIEANETVLAYGGHLKSTFCYVHRGQAYLSQHLGDLEGAATLEHFRETRGLYERLFAAPPTVIAHDLHPDYLSTKFALAGDAQRLIGVQHHHAHVVSCLAEHGSRGPAIGIAFDGLGYGADGRLWGGEVLIADWHGFARQAHFREVPMPGGESAIRKPYRMTLAYLDTLLPDEPDLYASFVQRFDPREAALLRQQLKRHLNAPLTSSCGRLFDAVSSLIGICSLSTYEGQAAAELEAAADRSAVGSYPVDLHTESDQLIMDPTPMLRALLLDQQRGETVGVIAMRFHRAIADGTAAVCERLGESTGLRQVALAGGVFQNRLLLDELAERLQLLGFDVLVPRRIPPNDGGLSFGQAMVALSHLESIGARGV